MRAISDFGFRISDFRTPRRLSLAVCLVFLLAAHSFAQNLDNLAGQIDNGSSEQKRSALFELRNRQTAEASRAALPALRDADEAVRATAAFAVIYLPPAEAFAALAPNLADPSELVRRETAYALGRVADRNAVGQLIETYRKDKSTEVKNACVQALGAIGDASALDFLIQILQQKPRSADDFGRRSAARAIGRIAQLAQIGKSAAVTPESFLPEKYKLDTLEKYRDLTAESPAFQQAAPVLIDVLQSPKESADTRREAAFALGALGAAAAAPVLQTNAASTDYYLAEICREALKKISSAANPE
ncbi:MAG: HEAT repeat domain-containing protein [Acidobacteria bacterium]|nr:HEAT repeat domain-containing protein [Acidobacteriota bacterium]